MSDHVRGRFWLVNDDGTEWIGIGRVQLLRAIEESGSIRQAAQRLGMSYKRAWSLVQAMNRLGPQPMVIRETGGRHGGGARLTAYGRRTLAVYAEVEAAMIRCAREVERVVADWAQDRQRGDGYDD